MENKSKTFIQWNKGLTKKTDERIRIQSENRIGQKRSIETKKKMSLAKMGKYNGRNNPFYGKHHTKESKAKISKTHKGKTVSMESRKKISRASKGRKLSEVVKNKLSKIHKKLWENQEWVKKQISIRQESPNKSERKLDKLLQQYFRDEWKYVGNGDFILGRKCPDFVNVNGKKLIIELFGEYWHKEEECQTRSDIFKEYGYDTLIIWSKELNKELKLLNKINSFMKSYLLNTLKAESELSSPVRLPNEQAIKPSDV